MKKELKKIITSPNQQFEEKIAFTFNEIFDAIDILASEHSTLVKTNSILMNTVKTIKKILIDEELITNEQFNEVYKDAENQSKNLLVSQSIVQYEQQKNMFYDFMINHMPPANS
ncbi:MAG: hypothetical protein JETCAE03_34260 [Ignavibacteriaceae bacterium]|jgi:hypothetical protein|nr:MAG: hypothetical protein JETCAE03_34260 [Ignavibacteriaceae bacterium]